jgi:dTDP-4-amino-4,6-dideoxygalactose transaminase
MFIPHSRPSIDEEDIKAVSEILASGRIAQGEKVKQFEDAIAKYVGTRFAVAVSSGTSALHLALLALGVGPGDEVILPSYVCASPLFAILQTNATPKLVDVDFVDFNINAASVRKQLSSKTKAIIAPHMFGNPVEMDELREFGIPVIEDCAQSLGGRYRGKPVGSLTELSVLSFYATKMITSGEGGMTLTDNDELYSRIMDLRDYDRKMLTPVKYNYKMTDFQAALGISQLGKLPSFVERRIELACLYDKSFSKYDIRRLEVSSHKQSVFYRYVVKVRRADHVQKIIRENGIMCEKPIFMPLHRSLTGYDCPNSDKAFEEGLSIPIHPSLSDAEVHYLLEKIELAFQTYANSCRNVDSASC